MGLLVWQRTGLWETWVLGPQGGRETSSEATEKTKRGRPGGSPGDFSEPAGGLPSASVECFCPLAAIFHPGRAESGGTGGAGRMVVTALSQRPRYTAIYPLCHALCSHSTGRMKGSDR